MTSKPRETPALRTLRVGAEMLSYCGIADTTAAYGRPVSELPYAIRILVENLRRHQLLGPEGIVTDRDVGAAVMWESRHGTGVPLHVERVILPDSSGLPVLQDLAALRDAVARAGGNARDVAPRVPVDLIVDHSLQVDQAGSPDAMAHNMRREFARNAERYRFLKWAQSAFPSLRVFPPGTGIIHQVNLEYLAAVVLRRKTRDRVMAVPDFVIGGDSHTPMVNGIGVLGWGVGGIDAEAAMLGQAYVFPVPDVIGVRFIGVLPPGVMTTDLALLVTERLRREKVVGSIVEFCGPGIETLSIPERATIANMAPEYGATAGFFPVDERTIDYLRQTRRDPDHAEFVTRYCKANDLFRDAEQAEPRYARIVEIDLSQVELSVAGPRRPQDRLPMSAVAADFRARLDKPFIDGGFAANRRSPVSVTTRKGVGEIGHGVVAIAAITSCTNTSNPGVMLAAGLLAKKAVEAGLSPPPWVKTSLAPGSRVVTRYLQETGLLAPLEALGFHVIGYGCTTCGGKSGPLDPAVAQAIEQDGLVAAAVLSGNRNFEGRIHRLVRANYICSPPLVVAYALAGRIDVDLAREPIGRSMAGDPVFLKDLWPSAEEIAPMLRAAADPGLFGEVYGNNRPDIALWDSLEAVPSERFPWDPGSHYLVEPPFFGTEMSSGAALPDNLSGARALALFGDSLTTDHISPSGEIPVDSPAGQYLVSLGVSPSDFNTYVARRCNHDVMTRATFANIRIKNLLVPDTEGGVTRHFPDGERMPIFDAAMAYRRERTPVIVLAGKEYGTGSSRDWAAKGSALLGIRAVLAESFERIHRANLVGMGVLPLQFQPGEGWRQLGLTGTESFELMDLRRGVFEGTPITVHARRGDNAISFTVTAQILTESEKRFIANGGLLPTVLEHFLAAQEAVSPRPAAQIQS